MKSVWIFICLFFIFLSSLLFAEIEWTVLVYIAADNTLFNAAFKDINEMEAVGSSDSVNIIVQVDPVDPDVYPSSYFDFGEARRYFITYDEDPDSIGSLLLASLGEINSADPTEVYSFANWGFNKYPSKKRMLILWDHGNGWQKGDTTKWVCSDASANYDNINVAYGELNQAISNIIQPLDILVFDACLMQMPEVIGEIYEYCDFVIGSEEVVPEDGLYYGEDDSIYPSESGLFNYLVNNPTCSPEIFSYEIVERYIKSYVEGFPPPQDGNNISISSINTVYFNQFQNELKYFTENFSDTLYNNYYTNTYSQCHKFDYNCNIDIWQFFSILIDYGAPEIESSAQDIKSLIDSMIVHSKAYYSEPDLSLGRMSVYFPQTYIRFFADWERYYQLSFVKETRWDRFLNFYFYEDNEPPEIIDFSISTQGNLLYFSWNAIDPSFIKYQLQYRTLNDTTHISILDSTSHQNYQISFPFDNYIFNLIAEDEFANQSDSTKSIFLSKETIFKFFPNPYFVNDDENGRFIFSTGNSEKAEIDIYNFAGELVEKLITLCEENSTCELQFSPENLSSGIYFCLLKTGDKTNILKLAIIR